MGDESYYAGIATAMAAGHGHVAREDSGVVLRALRPPGHPWLLSHFAGPRLHTLLRVQVAIGALLVLATAWLGTALFDARTGATAGAIAALYPSLVAHSHYFWSEPLFATLVTAALACAVHHARRPSLPSAVVTGLVFGAAALTREVAVPAAAATALWWAWSAPAARRRRALVQGGLMLAALVCVVLPWTLRNHQVLGRWVPVATVGWYAAGEGNALGDAWWKPFTPAARRFKQEYLEQRSETARLDFARARTLAMLRQEQPTWIGKKLLRTSGLLLSPDSALLQKLRGGSYGDPPRALVRLVLASCIVTWTGLLGLATLGIAGAGSRQRRLLPCLVLGAVVALHVLANATPRFRLPWLPLLIVYASHGALHWRACLARRPGIWLVVPVLVAATFLCVAVPQFARDAVDLWVGP